MRRTILAVAALVLLAGPAAAQYDDDEQTRDHERQDRRYADRQAERERAAEREGDDPAAAFVARAEELIRDRNYDGAESRHYRVQTDDPTLDPSAVATFLEGFRAHFGRSWAGRLAAEPDDSVARVFLFYSFAEFNRLLEDDWRGKELRPLGHYNRRTDAIALHTDAGDPSDLADALVHEAAHRLLDRGLFPGGSSVWLSEGLASYFGHTRRDRDGTFVAGAIGGKAVRLHREGRPASGREAARRLAELQRTLRGNDGDAGAFSRVVSIREPATFYGEGAPLHYAASWVLVHYLLHAEEGRHASAFDRYLALEARGAGGAEAFYRELDTNPESLDAAVAAYAKGLRAR